MENTESFIFYIIKILIYKYYYIKYVYTMFLHTFTLKSAAYQIHFNMEKYNFTRYS